MKKFLLVMAAVFAFGNENLLVSAGGGYKKIVEAVAQNLKKDGVNIDTSFANITAIMAQAKEGKTDVIVGDEDFLKKSDLKILEFVNLGQGALVLATKKGVKIEKIDELKRLSKIAMPDAVKTVYGKRASEFMQKAGLDGELKDKILAVNGVPQVVTYILNGEVDAGFINQTELNAHKDEFGSFILIDKALYTPANIVAAKLEGCEKKGDCVKFIDELKSERSKEIYAKFGIR